MSDFGKGLGSLWAQMLPSANRMSFGASLGSLWAANINRKDPSVPVHFDPNKTDIIHIGRVDVYDIRNDEQSRQYIEKLLRKKGITHKPTFDNLVFDYLNTPIGLRDAVIEQNIDQVKYQIQVRMEQIQAQQNFKHVVGSFDVVENHGPFGASLGSLWAANINRKDPSVPVHFGPNKTDIIHIGRVDVYDIRNDEQSRQYIEKLLRKKGITHKPTFDNLVFDYLNTPIGLRDAVIKQNTDQVKYQIQVRMEQIQAQQNFKHVVGSFDVVENHGPFGASLGSLWAANINRKDPPVPVHFGPNKTDIIHIGRVDVYDISNDEKSRAHIEKLLRKKGITHKPTFDNLVFDYLNTPIGLRDAVIEQNIDQVKDQINVRMEQMDAQQRSGHVVSSFDITESHQGNGYLESLEKRVSALENKLKIESLMTRNEGRLELLERKIGALEEILGLRVSQYTTSSAQCTTIISRTFITGDPKTAISSSVEQELDELDDR